MDILNSIVNLHTIKSWIVKTIKGTDTLYYVILCVYHIFSKKRGIPTVLYSISENDTERFACDFQVFALFMVSRIVQYFPQTYLTLYFIDTLQMDKVREWYINESSYKQ